MLKKLFQHIDIFTHRDQDNPLKNRISIHWADKLRTTFSVNLANRLARCQFEIDKSEDEVVTALAIPPVSVWITMGGRWIYNLTKGFNHVEYSLSFHDASIWWNLGTDPNCWSEKMPFWRRGNFSLADAILGKQEFQVSDTNKDISINVFLPEGSYQGSCKLETCQWKRAHWFPIVERRAVITMHQPIPIPGKGENSWDCEQDAIYSLTTPACSAGEAVGKLLTSVLSTREKRGGLNWQP